MITVKATREGLPGQKTASGYVVDSQVPFVALPSTAALRLWVIVRNPRNDRRVRALVLDVGPWNTADHAYVFCQATSPEWADGSYPGLAVRPQAESGTDHGGRKTNGAGIDLSERVWKDLGMMGNDLVTWEFV